MLGRHVIGWTPGASSIPATILEAAESARRLRARLFRRNGVTTAGLQADEAAFRQKYQSAVPYTVSAPLGRPVPGIHKSQYRRLSGRAVRPVICKCGLPPRRHRRLPRRPLPKPSSDAHDHGCVPSHARDPLAPTGAAAALSPQRQRMCVCAVQAPVPPPP
jgi:hypothetical protein